MLSLLLLPCFASQVVSRPKSVHPIVLLYRHNSYTMYMADVFGGCRESRLINDRLRGTSVSSTASMCVGCSASCASYMGCLALFGHTRPLALSPPTILSGIIIEAGLACR